MLRVEFYCIRAYKICLFRLVRGYYELQKKNIFFCAETLLFCLRFAVCCLFCMVHWVLFVDVLMALSTWLCVTFDVGLGAFLCGFLHVELAVCAKKIRKKKAPLA